MPLLGAHTTMGYLQTYRVLWCQGRMGGGKTAIAYRIAFDLMTKHGFRYLLSNVKSIWNDDFDKVELREGVYVDAVIILDEGGLFLENGYDAKQFLAYLRKLNIVLIIPSFQPPSNRLQFMSLQRMMNFQTIIGAPLWMYNVRLNFGGIQETERFYWWKPAEIYGIYDTGGFPSDDNGLAGYIQDWTNEAKKNSGYKVASIGSVAGGAVIDPALFASTAVSEQSTLQPVNGGDKRSNEMEELRRVTASFEDVAASISGSVSLLAKQNGKKEGVDYMSVVYLLAFFGLLGGWYAWANSGAAPKSSDIPVQDFDVVEQQSVVSSGFGAFLGADSEPVASSEILVTDELTPIFEVTLTSTMTETEVLNVSDTSGVDGVSTDPDASPVLDVGYASSTPRPDGWGRCVVYCDAVTGVPSGSGSGDPPLPLPTANDAQVGRLIGRQSTPTYNWTPAWQHWDVTLTPSPGLLPLP